MTPPCRLCKGTGIVLRNSPDGEEEAVMCKCRQQILQKHQLSHQLERYDIWPIEKQFGFSRYSGDRSRKCVDLLENYVNNFDKYKDCSIYAYGPPSTQKTTVLQWVGYRLNEQGIRAKWVHMPDFIARLAHAASMFLSVQEKEKEDALNEEFFEADVLIFDNAFDREKNIIWRNGLQSRLLDSFLRTRFTSHPCACIFISSHPPSEIAEQFNHKSLGEVVNRNLSATLEFLDPAPYNCLAGKPDLWKFEKVDTGA